MGRGVMHDAVQVATLSSVSLASLVANGLLLAVSLQSKSEATPGDLLVGAMAVADILVALAIPLVVAADFELLGGGDSMQCVVANSPAMAFPCLSVFMLIALTSERCINIFLPLRAISLVTRRRVVGVIAGVYLYALLLTLSLPLVGHNLHMKEGSNMTADCNFAAVSTAPLVAFLLLGNLVPGMIILLLLNGAIFCVARKHLHRITFRSPSTSVLGVGPFKVFSVVRFMGDCCWRDEFTGSWRV
ncbi:adenosine receptor A2b-like [Babylonia areolata]|uniref:adenosine receptor A2b-like n=1 Tax=Babylonia areolata TaxID=304850 RepID=UPI003FD5B59F